jgi:tetratricopeptide (TPR) repeat protein
MTASIESLVVEAMPADDRQLLRRGAVLRYITRPLAAVVTDSAQAAERLVEHPVVQGGVRGRTAELWTIPEPLRKALVAGWDAADEIRLRVAEAAAGLDALYARLAAAATRTAALTDLSADFAHALDAADVPRAHDLLRLLDEWPVADAAEARRTRDRLAPRLRRHSRALRDREATATYLERGFEDSLWEMLLADDGRWMLHLHAPGGRGKTMLVKNLLGRRCPAEDIPVARIDFDHVTQLGIATTEPWRLLLSIAAQLDPQLRDSPFGYMLALYGMFQNVTQPEALPRVAPVTAVAIGDHSDELAVDAAREVPSRFRKYLAAAVGDRPVIIALDTVENVLHTEGADLFPLLAAFSDIVHGTGGGGTGGDGVRVPGLRLIVSGRFDLAEERPVQAGRSRPRSPGFRSRWVGADSEIERYFPDGAEVLLGREVATLEMPAFTPAEAREFLTEQGGVTDPALVEAIVGRTHDNPMKLALIAEYVNRHPDVTAEAISAFEQIELYYLVERVVERIADERVQWLLRWGALLPVLTREAVEQVIWPALESLVRSGDSYDDTSQDPLPAPPDDVNRWPIPSAGAVGEPGAAGRAWETLLDYTAGSSWVSRVEELPDAVAFHPEIREPLRRLLRQGGNPVYDDIHRRAFAYWSGVVGQAQGATRAAALRAVLFHAYQPWQGADHAGDPLFHRLLADSIGDRAERAALAWEVLELSGGEVGPSAEVRSLAHLELAEATVDRANQHRTPVRESALSYHLGEVTDDVRAREPRRSEFLHAVLADSSGRVDECWAAMDRALGHPPADMHLPLVTAWIAPRTPPPGALDTVRRLLAETTGTPYAAPVAQALTDGLLAAERWIEARDLADLARSPDLRCACLLAVGDPDAVLADPAAAGIWRARARLLRFEPTAALLDLDLDTPTAGKASMRTPADLLVRGLAYGQLDRFEEATDALSQAASSQDTAVSIEASLALARYLGRLGRNQLASSHLRRLAGFADLLVVLRAKTTEAGLYGRDNPALGAALLLEAETLAATTATLRPSAAVELAIARLAVRGVTDEGLTGLRDALAAVQGAGPRLLALRGLADVDSPRMPVAAPVADELRRLTPLEGGTAALVLARAELDRVLGDERGAAGLLGRLTGGRAGDDDETLARTVADAGRRLASPPSLGGPDADSDGLTDAFERRLDLDPGHADTDGGSLSHAEEIVTLRLSTDPGGEMIWIEVDGAPDLPPVPLPPDIVNWGAADLVRSPAVILDRLREALLTPYVRDRLRGSETPRLHLLADAEAARWPWEVAVRGEAGVLRRQAGTPRITARPEPSRTVLVTIPNERKDRGHVADLVTSYYDGRATILPRLFPTSSPLPPGGGILHVVADPVQRRGLPGLQLPSGDLLTAESMARSLGDGPWLVILDLVLTADDYDAAEQLMIGNVFCWHLVRNAPDVDVLCGMFSAGDRIDSLRRLAGHLAAGEPLTTVGDDLQRARPALPGGRPPWRDFVSLSTDSPYRRYRLAEPA